MAVSSAIQTGSNSPKRRANDSDFIHVKIFTVRRNFLNGTVSKVYLNTNYTKNTNSHKIFIVDNYTDDEFTSFIRERGRGGDIAGY
jgi:hypothetical protein